MKKILNSSYLLFAARIVLGFIFIYAAVEKINDPGNFAGSIHNYKLLPLFMVNFFAVVLPWIELISGMLLILGVAAKESSVIASALISLFTIAVIISLIRGLNIDCGCFGTAGGAKIGSQKIAENLLLFALSVYLYFLGPGNITLPLSKHEADLMHPD